MASPGSTPDSNRDPHSDGVDRTRRRSSLPRNFGRNFFTSYLRTGSSAVISLVMTPVLVAGLGTQAFGVWILVNSLAVYRDVLQFGFVAATPKYVAERTALRDHNGVRAVIATSFWILAGLGALATLIGLGIAAVFSDIFGVPSELRAAAELLVLIMVIDFALSMPFNAFAGALMGLQRYDLLNAIQIAVMLAQALGWAIVLALGGGLVPLGIVTVALGLAGHLSRYLTVRRLVPGLTLSPRRSDRTLVRDFAGFSVWLALADSAYILVHRVDTIIAGLILGVGPAAVYGVAQRLAFALRQVVEPVSTLFFPHSSELAARRDLAGSRRAVVTGTRIQLAIAGPLALTAAVLAGPFLEAWVGPEFSAAVPVVVFLCATVVVWVTSDVAQTMLLGAGQARNPALISALGAGLNVGLSVLLAYLIGLEGVALGSLVAAVVADLIILFPYACRQFGMRLRDLGMPLIKAHLPAGGIALLVGLAISRAEPEGFLAVAGAAVAILATYLAVLAITGLDNAERRELIARAQMRSRPHVPPA